MEGRADFVTPISDAIIMHIVIIIYKFISLFLIVVFILFSFSFELLHLNWLKSRLYRIIGYRMVVNRETNVKDILFFNRTVLLHLILLHLNILCLANIRDVTRRIMKPNQWLLMLFVISGIRICSVFGPNQMHFSLFSARCPCLVSSV